MSTKVDSLLKRMSQRQHELPLSGFQASSWHINATFVRTNPLRCGVELGAIECLLQSQGSVTEIIEERLS